MIRVGFKFGFLNYLQTDISSTLFAEQNDVAEGEATTPGYAVFNLLLNTTPIIFNNFSFRIYSGVENF